MHKDRTDIQNIFTIETIGHDSHDSVSLTKYASDLIHMKAAKRTIADINTNAENA